MNTIAFTLTALIALALALLLTRLPDPPPARRRDRPNSLLRDVALIYLVALLFPIWDYVLIDTLGLPLVRIWSPRPDITIGAAILLVLPPFIAVARRGHLGPMGWDVPRRGGPSALVILVLTLLGALPLLLGVPVMRADTFTLILSFVTIALLDENLFRGAIQSRLEAVLAGAWPWLLTALLYGLWYAPGLLVQFGPAAGGTLMDALLRLWVQVSLGLVLSVLRSRTGSLLPGLVAHYLFLQIGPLLALLLGR